MVNRSTAGEIWLKCQTCGLPVRIMWATDADGQQIQHSIHNPFCQRTIVTMTVHNPKRLGVITSDGY